MKTLKQTRKENLVSIFRMLYGTKRGGIARFSDLLGKSPSLVSRYLAPPDKPGSKAIGEEFSREIEKSLSLPIYTMDHERLVFGGNSGDISEIQFPDGTRISLLLNDKNVSSQVLPNQRQSISDVLDAPLETSINVPLIEQNTKVINSGETMLNDFGLQREQIPKSILDKAGLETTAARLIKVSGDSMYPTLINGDLVLADATNKVIKNGGIFAFVFDDRLLIKRFTKRLDGYWVISSDNKDDPNFMDEPMAASEVEKLNVVARCCKVIERTL